MLTATVIRPIRELVNSKKLQPTGRGSAARERRKVARFTCRIPAVLASAGREFPVECLEISSIGARVTSHRPLPLQIDQKAQLRIRVGPQHFADEFLVVHLSRPLRGPILIGLKVETASGLEDDSGW